MKVAGVDVGGTNIAVGLIDDDHAVLDRRKVDTPTAGPEAVADTIAELVADFDDAAQAVGVGIPGGVHDGTIVHVPNLSNWAGDVPLRQMLVDRLRVPIALGNDADIGLLGEWMAGAARGRNDVLGVWMGTGIGGALIINGQPYRGSYGAAGEIGHIIVRADGALCHCGRRGCVEAYAGRRSMADTIRTIATGGRDTSLFEIQDEEGKPRPTSRVWERALADGDPLAVETFDAAIEALGLGIGSTVNLLDPELVVVGGGMAEKLGQDLADRIDAAARPSMLHPNPDLRFVAAELGDDSGLIGAAGLARAELVAS